MTAPTRWGDALADELLVPAVAALEIGASPSSSSAVVPTFGARLRQARARLTLRLARDDPAQPGQWLGRFLVLRLLGLVYLMAFTTLVNQGPALLGPRGLLPIEPYLEAVAQHFGSRAAGFWALPSIFWVAQSDHALVGVGIVGIVLSASLLAGWSNAIALLMLVALQLSIANVGQTFYAFGWEIQLVETGFLCVFLCPLIDPRPFPRRAPPVLVVWLLRWLAARIMWGAGLIKLRGDPCWRDLTCLDFHFETQPVPNPLTPLFHAMPSWAHGVGVVFNHAVELVAPFFILGVGPRRVRRLAAALMVALQLVLIASGNLSFLNWLTLVPILACFDDALWRRVLPAGLVARAERARAVARPSRAVHTAAILLAVTVAALSVPPVLNLLSGRQLMNTSFTRLPLVNTYGAFGTVGRERAQLVIEGTRDAVLSPTTHWQTYQPKCQPADPMRRPCWMSPYHYRLDWLMWFAAMEGPREAPWMVHLVWKLLEGDPGALGLLSVAPFGSAPPSYVRVELYRYRLAGLGAPVWWTRTRLGAWLPPVSKDDPALRRFLETRGWLPTAHETMTPPL